MKTRVFTDKLREAAEIIKNGGLVAVPTETVYGLAGNGLDERAVREIYEVKGRPAVKPLSLMVSGAEEMDRFCLDVPEQARLLAEKFWPGPLTVVLKARDFIPSIVLAGGTTVGLRCPDHEMTLELLRLSGVPFAAPSANPSGSDSPKTAQKVLEYFDGRIDAVADGGECGLGFESTIIDMTRTPYSILRQGALPREKIEDALMGGMKIIGITGGTGCGKTTALLEIEKLGGAVLDCDRIYHELLENSGAMTDELRDSFPEAFSDGTFDRKALGKLVFAHEEKLRALNRITHRYVRREVTERLRSCAMGGYRLAAIDAVELIESGISEVCDTVIWVTAPEDSRARRIVERDGIDMEYALSRIKAQKGEEYYRTGCGRVIVNDGDMDEFSEKCRKMIEEVLNNG